MFFHRINDRHSLRQLSVRDAEELFSVLDASRAHLRHWLPWLDRTRSVADSRQFLTEVVQQAEVNHNIHAAILLDGRIVGVASYHRIDWQNRNTAIGYWIAAPQEGQGLVTASCQVLVDHAFAALNLHRLAIACATGNARSRAIPPRLGFVHEGRQRDAEWLYDHFVDHEIYVQLQPQWEARMITRLADTIPRPK
ncbi:GCN5-related N-acetyltransferase [Chthoniobacter flavus Ellin428]|uniref:GCN5-related N-acetyltransferase n=1 Tax=Chthoniobacter flavus Ellin428 TaxID=497964 RepID=B4CV76_9BACT|nr:GNAT family protein [Chthoniobacter flavus]EDY22464.1 GCN5-related N-acetyltransferase [Chthoniobacter flavus Ellin428]TCO82122.1 ribosomal-protein-serine acetyltransferase [Chthoniobacter flavus]